MSIKFIFTSLISLKNLISQENWLNCLSQKTVLKSQVDDWSNISSFQWSTSNNDFFNREILMQNFIVKIPVKQVL